ncbi:TIGR03943 family protein [Lysinibacillus sphaericus]|uniref:TIGR03943 family putative permease subunit n=1 Tax=Lysinibacillus sphaericus TaxID=1421 RepID=UPI0021617FA9|nr:TIGR03943 family protein [Lysinibacillus sphaericus]MCS1382607.1 TIGR03943 family protein [Lysinibacillus sphaericus]
MKFHLQQAVKAVILCAFSVMIFNLHATGEITKLINPKYEMLSKTVAIIFLVLFVAQLKRIFSFSNHRNHNELCKCCAHNLVNPPFNWKRVLSYLILVVPLFTGFTLPTKFLDASIAQKKGATLMMTNQSQASKKDEVASRNEVNNDGLLIDHPIDPKLLEEKQEMSKKEYDLLKQQLAQNPIVEMTNYIFSVYYEDINNNLSQYQGKKIRLSGFVLKETDLLENQFVISRFLITHCVADASIIGFLTEMPEAASLQEDSWIEAEGTIDIGYYNGVELPIIRIEQWKNIQEPAEPYIYPIDILISM